jgi:transcriptional regulator with XRE-family HTH domain
VSEESAKRREKPVAIGFARRLKACRKAAGITQEGLAALAGIHRTETSLLERGLREPKLGTLMKVAAVLDLALGELLGETRWSAEGGYEFEEEEADV